MTSVFHRLGTAVAVLAAAAFFSSCASPLARRPPPRAQIPLYDWHDDGIGGPVAIKIDLTSQRLTAYRGGRPIGWSVVATGIPGHSTPAGHYKVSEKVEDKYSTLYGVIKNAEGITINRDAKMGRDAIPPGCQFVPAPMPYWQRLSHTAFGMHAGPIPHPGRPASHGCVRLPRETANHLFGITKIGTPINVVP